MPARLQAIPGIAQSPIDFREDDITFIDRLHRPERCPLRPLQFHWHTPAGHEIEGRDTPLEMHLVHRRVDGSLLVIGVFSEAGHKNQRSPTESRVAAPLRRLHALHRERLEHPDRRFEPGVALSSRALIGR